METIVRKAYSKINLTLEILEKRADGYHNIRSVMQKVSLCDTITFEKNNSCGIRLFCDRNVCPPEDNLAYKAAVLYRDKYRENTGRDFGISISIHKQIPDKAGLAGGSADCACVLDTLYCEIGGVDYGTIESIASSLGSDINFCLDKYRCALCTDRGIALEKCSSFVCDNILICVPDFGMKTSDIYRAFDSSPVMFPGDPSGKVKFLLDSGKGEDIYPFISNAFSPVCENSCKDITYIKSVMREYGAAAAEMSGSGSSVFGLFKNRSDMYAAKEKLSENFEKCFVCSTITE